MNYRLVLLVASSGLLMGIASVAGLVPIGQEGPALVLIALVAALWISRHAGDRPFGHGFAAGCIAGAVLPLVQGIFFGTYTMHNPHAAEAFRQLPSGASPRLLMLLLAPFLAVLTGFVFGFLSWAVAKGLRRKAAAGA